NSYDSNLKIRVLLCVLHKPVLLQNYAFCVSPMSKDGLETTLHMLLLHWFNLDISRV
ncbi:hypothetical protein AAKU64_000208, partial [Undibacterium sp. GrIS 1.8]